MAFQQLAPELVHQIYDNLSTISDVFNLSLTCRRFHNLLRNAHKLNTLFSAAEREFGPVEDIIMIVTHNYSQAAHIRRDPPMSYPLLRQIVAVGLVGKRFEKLYPSKRWDTDFINRRALTSNEAFRVRRALYRYWLYSVAFHNRFHRRTNRLSRSSIEERSQLLRNWSNQELLEVEDVRSILEDILTLQICPTDGIVRARMGKDSVFVQWHHSFLPNSPRNRHRPEHFHSLLFHNTHKDDCDSVLSPAQARTTKMEGWGDEISQYHVVQSMLKLDPAQILWLHDHAVYKWQVELLIHDLGEDWFWNNGQTFSDTFSIVFHARGLDVDEMRNGVLDGCLGVAVSGEEEEELGRRGDDDINNTAGG